MTFTPVFFAAMDREMAAAGYRRKSKGFYERTESPDVRARVIVYGTVDRSTGSLGVISHLGVFFPSVYQMEGKCLDGSRYRPSRTTLTMPLRYRDQNTHVLLTVDSDPDAESAAKHIRDLYEGVGREFIAEFSDLRACLAEYRRHVEWDASGHTMKALAIAAVADSDGAAWEMVNQAREALSRNDFEDRAQFVSFLVKLESELPPRFGGRS